MVSRMVIIVPTAGGPDTITRSSGSWIEDGFQPGQQILVTGTDHNDHTLTIFGVSDTQLTFDGDVLTDETSGATIDFPAAVARRS